eukprot:TRINITY_DN14316_c0_g1_i1.p1 TRINITY_DN14316_c0_g1~~TRINITY_DN14316_c0_g1_i1.p1  ORF type:complete len:500 (-),score=113.16 TRINITY_DN14316_c0_g1_i1:34-1533(-)
MNFWSRGSGAKPKMCWSACRSGALEPEEFKHFVTYVGFGPETADELLKRADRDESGTVTLDEFALFAGRVGGIYALLERRRRLLDTAKGADEDALQVGSRVRAHYLLNGVMSKEVWDARVLQRSANGKVVKLEFSLGELKLEQEVPREMVEEDVDLVEALASIGILDDAHHYWALLLPPEEQHAVKALTECQRKALFHTRTLATQSHTEAIGKLLERCESIGVPSSDLWSVLTWLRDLAPVIVMVNLDKVGEFFETDTHYRNQFETKSSCGLLNTGVRDRWERELFGGCYDGAEPFERPKYGVLDVMNDHRGVICARQYGDSYMHLRDVRLRATFAPQDSGGIRGSRLAVLDQYAHVLLEYSDRELREVTRVATAPEGSDSRIGDSEKLERYHYKEAQFHGEIDLSKHVQRLVVHPRHRVDGLEEERIRAICEAKGWEFMWMDDERRRRIYEERQSRDGKALECSWASSAVIKPRGSTLGGQASGLSQLFSQSDIAKKG